MSNAIFPMPTLPAGSRGWNYEKSMVFPETILQIPPSLRGETRISRGPFCAWKFVMNFPLLSGTLNDPTSALAKVVGFYGQMGGQASTWLLDDPDDNTIPSSAPVAFGVGDGLTTAFQIVRPIANFQDIIQNLNGSPSIYLGGVLQSSGYSIDQLGVVTFSSAPGVNVALTWSGKYYFRCRFLKDSMDGLTAKAKSFWTVKQIDWQSVIL